MTEIMASTVPNMTRQIDLHENANWKGLYKTGGVCMVATGALYLLGAVLSIILGPVPSSAESYMTAVGAHAGLAQINFGVFAATDFLLIPGMLAVYMALRKVAPGAILIATGFVAVFIVLDLAVTEMNSLALVSLTRHHALALSEEQKGAQVAAADFALATLPIATFYSYVVSSVGFLLTSLVMLKGGFNKVAAILGIVACTEGIIGGFYVVFPAAAGLLIPSLITFALWAVFTGRTLYRIGKHSE